MPYPRTHQKGSKCGHPAPPHYVAIFDSNIISMVFADERKALFSKQLVRQYWFR